MPAQIRVVQQLKNLPVCDDLWRTLQRAASTFMSRLGMPGVEKSLDAAGRSAHATSHPAALWV
jgi:hypothetical protein